MDIFVEVFFSPLEVPWSLNFIPFRQICLFFLIAKICLVLSSDCESSNGKEYP